MKKPHATALAAVVLCVTVNLQAVTLYQSDSFASGTNNWGGGTGGGRPAPVQEPSGGPVGSGDAYLQLVTSGFHLGAKNEVQWAGDYAAAGVTRITLDANVFGPDPVDLRLLLFGPGGTWATSSLSPLPADSTWHHLTYSLLPPAMVHVSGGTGVLGDTLSAVDTLLIRNDRVTPTLPGQHPPHITTTMGLDNILGAPEPSSSLLLLLGGALLWQVRIRERA